MSESIRPVPESEIKQAAGDPAEMAAYVEAQPAQNELSWEERVRIDALYAFTEKNQPFRFLNHI